MAIQWRPVEPVDARRDELYCTECHGTRFVVRSEPVRRKRHTRDSHKRRIVAVCKRCSRVRRLAYGGARGRVRGRRRAAAK